MNKQEELLKNAIEKTTPDVWDSIVRDLKAEEAVPEIRQVKVRKTPAPWIKRFSAVAACLVVLIGGIWGFNGYQLAHAVDSIISLDVNPSIEITTNAKDRVIDVKAGNEDGEKIIGDMDFSGSDIDVALNALLGSLLRNGYISDMANSILVTVDNKDAVKGEAMRQKLLSDISSLLDQEGLEGAVLSQVVEEEDKAMAELAAQYGITLGKAQLISEIIKGNTRYAFEDLADLTINELNLIAASPKVQLEKVQAEGKASDKGYIGSDKAIEIAMEAAGVKAADARDVEFEMDYEAGVMVYEVEFETATGEYEFDINALTGEIVKNEMAGSEADDDDDDDDDDADDDDDDDDADDDEDDDDDDDDADDDEDDDDKEDDD